MKSDSRIKCKSNVITYSVSDSHLSISIEALPQHSFKDKEKILNINFKYKILNIWC